MPRTIVSAGEALTTEELLARANVAMEREDYLGALRDLERLLVTEPHGALAPRALYLRSLCQDELGQLSAAAEGFAEVATRYSSVPFARHARVRAVRLLVHLETWERAGKLAAPLLTEPDVSPLDRIVAEGAAALALIEHGEDRLAEQHVEFARSLADSQGYDHLERLPRDLAVLSYARGEILRLRAERISFEPLPSNFSALLEERCQYLLEAQSAYSDAMRAYDSHWSTMAGYRVGELYLRLHEALMSVHPPRTTDDAEAKLFEAAMRLRYSILVTKGLGMLEHTLAMARRTGEHSSWVERTESAYAKLMALKQSEEQALARSGFDRSTLENALERLAVQHSTGRSSENVSKKSENNRALSRD